jgi:hypothetical protein
MPGFLNFDFGYTDIEDELARNRCIENTASAQLALLWEESIHEAYRALPGLGKENRASDVYWLSNHRHTPIRACLSPTRSFYPGPFTAQENKGCCAHHEVIMSVLLGIKLGTPCPGVKAGAGSTIVTD